MLGLLVGTDGLCLVLQHGLWASRNYSGMLSEMLGYPGLSLGSVLRVVGQYLDHKVPDLLPVQAEGLIPSVALRLLFLRCFWPSVHLGGTERKPNSLPPDSAGPSLTKGCPFSL